MNPGAEGRTTAGLVLDMMWCSIALIVLLILWLQPVKFFMLISSDQTCLLVKDYVSSLSMPNRHTAPQSQLSLRFAICVRVPSAVISLELIHDANYTAGSGVNGRCVDGDAGALLLRSLNHMITT